MKNKRNVLPRDRRLVDAFCVACGALVGYEETFGGRVRYECGREKPDPKSQVVWGSIYRTIYRTAEDEPYRLSGLGRYNAYLGEKLTPALDRDGDESDAGQDGRCGSLNIDYFILNANFLQQDEERYFPHGFLIHAHCWTLIERIIGPQAEERIDLFLQVLRQRWEQRPFDIHQYYGEDFAGPGEQGERWYEPLYLGYEYPTDDELHYICEDEYPNLRGHNRIVSDIATRDVICLRDPIKIPRLHSLISRCAADGAREEMKQKTRTWHPITNDNTDHLVPGGVPLDIKFCILDYLGGCDIRSALLAFGWNLPQQYFQARIPKKLILEIEDPESLSQMNWKRLFFGVEGLLESSPEIENRQRILRILEGTKELFAAMGGYDDGIKD